MRRCLAVLLGTLLLSWTTLGAQPAPSDDDSLFWSALEWRPIGPANFGGRITDVEGVPGTRTFYVVAAAGGIWKTTNNGTSFRPVFDGERVISMGDLAIAPSDPQVIWAGTGEEDSRNSISPGGGVYRSTDGGETWTLTGLEATQVVGRIVAHPTDSDVAWVAALGRIWGPNPERGLYKTTDGGQTWRLVKHISERAGFVDVVLHPRDPGTLFAASWERVRGPWYLKSGGPGSALWKSTDGGESWTEVSGGGFPATEKGRIGLAIAPSDPDVMYALVEAEKGEDAEAEGQKGSGLYRSADGGRTWALMSSNNVRPFYYSQVRVDPRDPDYVVWSSTPVNFSKDGGKTVGQTTLGIHVDHHAMWWDPTDSDHYIVGNDGGVAVTWDKGGTYDFINNIPLGQFYDVSYDMSVPYRVCGGLQDNGTWCGPSRRARGDITSHTWATIHGGDGFYSAQDPRNPAIVYAESQRGNMSRVNLASGQRESLEKPSWRDATKALRDSIAVLKGDDLDRELSVAEQERVAAWQAAISADSAALDLRYNWNTPFLLSPHDPDVFYAAGNRVLRAVAGAPLEPISPDLTYADTVKIRVSTQTTGGITRDATGAETYATITALAESPRVRGLLYAGTDDGRVWKSPDAGASWEELTGRFPGVPAGTYVSRVTPSAHEEDRVYVAFDGHRMDDFTPYVYASGDGGRSFRSIASDLPTGSADFVHVVTEDPVNPDLLYVGTDVGAYVSVDRGGSWRRFMAGLPTVPVHDLEVHPRDRELIAATHGRSIWIVDIAPLQQRGAALTAQAVAFEPKPALQYGDSPMGGESAGHRVFTGRSPGFGAEIAYWVPPVVAERLARAGSDGAERGSNGEGERRPRQQAAAGARADRTAAATRPEGSRRGAPGARRSSGPQASIVVLSAAGDTVQTLTGPARAGLHRVYWNLRARPVATPLSPSERADSIASARLVRTVVDSMVEAGSIAPELAERVLAQMENPDRSALFRSSGGGGARDPLRPGESYPRPREERADTAPRRAGAEDAEALQEAVREVFSAVRRAGGGGSFGRRGGGGEVVDPGSYRVVVTVGEESWTVPLEVVRGAGFDGEGVGPEQAEVERWWEKQWR